LLEVYKAYFPNEVKGDRGGMLEDTMWKTNERQVFLFLHEFDVCPSLLSKSVAFQVWTHTKDAEQAIYMQAGLDIIALMQNYRRSDRGHSPTNDSSKKVGKHFTFFRFLDLIMKCAKMTFTGYSTGSESQIYSNFQQSSLLEAEMLCLLLERMELSRGFGNLEKKTYRTHTSKITLLPRK
jgi:hypothetical protein